MMAKLAFFYDDADEYVSDDPAVYPDPGQFPEVRYVLRHFATIRDEVSGYLDGTLDIPYAHPSPPKMNGPQVWKNIYFKNYLVPYRLGRTHFPRTFRLFADRPEFTLAGITRLAPGGRLLSHCGETNAVIRCHVGLRVPGTLPTVGMRVRGETIGWQEGQAFAFTDAYQHEVWNDADAPRYVLAFDIVRPELRRWQRAICAYVLAIQGTRFVLERLGVFSATPRRVRALCATAAFPLTWSFLALRALGTFVRRGGRPVPPLCDDDDAAPAAVACGDPAAAPLAPGLLRR